MPQTIRFAIVIEAVIDDPVAVAATDVSSIRDEAAGTVEPFILPAEEVLKSVAARGAAVAIDGLPGAKFRSTSILPFPWNASGAA